MCYKIHTHESPMAASRHLLLMLYLRSLHARNRGGFAGSSNGESQWLLQQQLQHPLMTLKGRHEVSELPAWPSQGTRRPPEALIRQQQLLHFTQLMLLLH